MPKPIIVAIPEKDREALRGCGTLPASSFLSMGEAGAADGVCLWPHPITYDMSIDWVERVKEKPADVPVFFGMSEAVGVEAMRNEAEIARLLRATVVHVVFLDTEAAEREYTVFRSFTEIAKWGRQFKAVLAARYLNDPYLAMTENVLVVVARGEQVRSTPEEIQTFQDCIGVDACFTSCYFLDFKLSAADGPAGLIHSHFVWDVMVGRLLLGFLLSREQGTDVWRGGGVRLWRAGEFVVNLPGWCEKEVAGAVKEAHGKLRNMIDDPAVKNGAAGQTGEDELPPPPPSLGECPGLLGVGKVRAGEWADFDTAAFAKSQAEPSRWVKPFEKLKAAADEWRKSPAHVPSGGAEFFGVFTRVGAHPGVLFDETEKLHLKLQGERKTLRARAKDAFVSQWDKILAKEKEREAKLKELEACGAELAKAQLHYVGRLPAFAVVVAVTVLCGASIGLIANALGLGWGIMVWLSLSVMCGSLAAALSVLGLHRWKGVAGAEALVEIGREADNLMVKKTDAVRDMVVAASTLRARLRGQNQRFKTILLLNRAKSFLSTETQCARQDGEGAKKSAPAPAARNAAGNTARETLLENTRKTLDIEGAGLTSEGRQEISKIITKWWESKVSGESFKALWRQLCHRHDGGGKGNFPARVFIPVLREYMKNYTASVRGEVWRQMLLETNTRQKLSCELRDWLGTVLNDGGLRRFCSGAFTLDDEQGEALIRVRKDENILNSAMLGSLQQIIDGRGGGAELSQSAVLGAFPQMAFYFQEYKVALDTDADCRLEFKNVFNAGRKR